MQVDQVSRISEVSPKKNDAASSCQKLIGLSRGQLHNLEKPNCSTAINRSTVVNRKTAIATLQSQLCKSASQGQISSRLIETDFRGAVARRPQRAYLVCAPPPKGPCISNLVSILEPCQRPTNHALIHRGLLLRAVHHYTGSSIFPPPYLFHDRFHAPHVLLPAQPPLAHLVLDHGSRRYHHRIPSVLDPRTPGIIRFSSSQTRP